MTGFGWLTIFFVTVWNSKFHWINSTKSFWILSQCSIQSPSSGTIPVTCLNPSCKLIITITVFRNGFYVISSPILHIWAIYIYGPYTYGPCTKLYIKTKLKICSQISHSFDRLELDTKLQTSDFDTVAEI